MYAQKHFTPIKKREFFSSKKHASNLFQIGLNAKYLTNIDTAINQFLIGINFAFQNRLLADHLNYSFHLSPSVNTNGNLYEFEGGIKLNYFLSNACYFNDDYYPIFFSSLNFYIGASPTYMILKQDKGSKSDFFFQIPFGLEGQFGNKFLSIGYSKYFKNFLKINGAIQFTIRLNTNDVLGGQ